MNFEGVQTVVKLEGSDLVTGTIQDCTPIAERMKSLHNEGFHGSSEMKFAGSIPFVMVEKYLNDNGITFAEFAASQDHKKRLLMDPALDHFRVWKGRI